MQLVLVHVVTKFGKNVPLVTKHSETITKATEQFHAEVANAYGLFATTMTIYNNVSNVDELVLRFEKLFKDSFSSEEQIKNVVSDIESQINESYASSNPVYVSF